MMRILLAEDERDLNRIVSNKLTKEGYAVDSCFDGDVALEHIESGAEYDAILLDIMMPKTDGLAVLKRMRDCGDATPVLFLTARDAIADRVAGLDGGANDYLVKPFSFAELLARIRVMTRGKVAAVTNVLQVADLSVDRGSRTVRRGKREIALSAKEFAVLEYLTLNAGTVLSREKIEGHVWSFAEEPGSNVVDVYIRYLRKKIDEHVEVKLIHTVRGVGYMLKESEAC